MAKTLELYSPTLVYMVLKKDDGSRRKTPPSPPFVRGEQSRCPHYGCSPITKGGTSLPPRLTKGGTSPPPLAKGGIEGGWIEIAKSDPQQPPPGDQRIAFTAPQDGDYLLEVQHLTYAGGPSEAYHLSIAPTVAGFDLSMGLDRYDLAPDSFVAINLVVNRRGYAGPIEVSAKGTPHGGAMRDPQLVGSTTIKEGQTSGTLLVTATPGAALGPYELSLIGKAVIDSRLVSHPVSVSSAVNAGLSGLTFPPLQLNTQIAIAVKEKAPFAIAAHMDPPEAVPGIAA